MTKYLLRNQTCFSLIINVESNFHGLPFFGMFQAFAVKEMQGTFTPTVGKSTADKLTLNFKTQTPVYLNFIHKLLHSTALALLCSAYSA